MLTAQQKVTPYDGTNAATIKAASTAPDVADTSEVVSLSPNMTGLPVNVADIVGAGVGNVTASGTTVDMSITPTLGNTLVVSCGINNTGTISAGDTGGLEAWYTAKSQTGTVAGSSISYAFVASASAHTVRCTAGTSGVVMGIVYQVKGLLRQIPAQPDSTDSNTGSSQSFAVLSAGISPSAPNGIIFAAPVLTANNLCATTANWTIDNIQQGATGGHLCVLRQTFDDIDKITGNVAFLLSSSNYAMAVAEFQSVHLAVEGQVRLYDGTNVANITSGNALKTDLTSSGGTAFSAAGKVDVKAATGDLNDNVAQIGGSTVSTAATGVQKVGVVGSTGTSFETTAGVLDHNLKNIGNAAVSTAASGIQKVGITGNVGAAFDAANNAALPANALTVGFETATQTTTQPTASTAGNMRFGLARTDGTLYVAPHGPVIWSCGLNAIAATLTQCQAAPAAGLRLYITDVISQSNTSTAGLFTLRFGTGSNCGTGTGNLIFNSASALMASPANTVAVNHFHLTVPIPVTAANAVCVLGVATNTTNIEINGYTAP